MCKMKVTIHSLDQKMIGQHYSSKISISSVKPGDLHKNWASREQSFGSTTLFLGIYGASGLTSGLGNDTGALGYFWNAKRGKMGEREEKRSKKVGCPRILYIWAEASHYAERNAQLRGA